MESLGDRKFVEIPGSAIHELPPLLVKMDPHVKRLDNLLRMANEVVDLEDMVPTNLLDGAMPGHERDSRKMDLALNLVDSYLALHRHWQWGRDILKWVDQCETTFRHNADLYALLRPDIWPHTGRPSFVTLLKDKSVKAGGIGLEKAVGIGLSFRVFPPLKCCSNQFLIYLNNNVARSAYTTWTGMTPPPNSDLPPERFMFNVFNMSLDE